MTGAMNTSTKTLADLDQRRCKVVEEMLAILSACRGKISEQFLKVHHKGKKAPVLRGPYYVLTWWEDGHTKSCRIKKDELAQTREEVANYERLKALSREFEELTQALGNADQIGV